MFFDFIFVTSIPIVVFMQSALSLAEDNSAEIDCTSTHRDVARMLLGLARLNIRHAAICQLVTEITVKQLDAEELRNQTDKSLFGKDKVLFELPKLSEINARSRNNRRLQVTEATMSSILSAMRCMKVFHWPLLHAAIESVRSSTAGTDLPIRTTAESCRGRLSSGLSLNAVVGKKAEQTHFSSAAPQQTPYSAVDVCLEDPSFTNAPPPVFITSIGNNPTLFPGAPRGSVLSGGGSDCSNVLKTSLSGRNELLHNQIIKSTSTLFSDQTQLHDMQALVDALAYLVAPGLPKPLRQVALRLQRNLRPLHQQVRLEALAAAAEIIPNGKRIGKGELKEMIRKDMGRNNKGCRIRTPKEVSGTLTRSNSSGPAQSNTGTVTRSDPIKSLFGKGIWSSYSRLNYLSLLVEILAERRLLLLASTELKRGLRKSRNLFAASNLEEELFEGFSVVVQAWLSILSHCFVNGVANNYSLEMNVRCLSILLTVESLLFPSDSEKDMKTTQEVANIAGMDRHPLSSSRTVVGHLKILLTSAIEKQLDFKLLESNITISTFVSIGTLACLLLVARMNSLPQECKLPSWIRTMLIRFTHQINSDCNAHAVKRDEGLEGDFGDSEIFTSGNNCIEIDQKVSINVSNDTEEAAGKDDEKESFIISDSTEWQQGFNEPGRCLIPRQGKTIPLKDDFTPFCDEDWNDDTAAGCHERTMEYHLPVAYYGEEKQRYKMPSILSQLYSETLKALPSDFGCGTSS